MEIVGQLSGQMADMVVGVVETVGEELEREGIPEQHEDEEEELTKVSLHSWWPEGGQEFHQSLTLSCFTGRRGNINLGPGAVLPDAVTPEGGGPVDQGFEPRDHDAECGMCRRQDAVRCCALRRPVHGREGRRHRGRLRCRCCHQLNSTGNKYSNNQ